MRKRWLIPALALLAGCTPPESGQQVEFKAPVFVRDVGTGTVEDRIVATGSLRAMEAISLRADTAGVLANARDESGRRIAEGDRVEAGQLIVEITGEEVKLAARTDATHRRYETALQDYESKKKLYDEGLISALEFRPFESTLAESRLEWEQSLLTESRSRLVTPISGVILQLARDEQGLPVADGQLVIQGTTVAQIAPTGKLIADVDLVGPDVTRVTAKLPARVRHHGWEGESFEGTVRRLAPILDPVTRTLRAEVEIDNSDGRLRPGMFVEVTMIAERRVDVPVVPREALTERGGRKVLFVVEGQKVTKREVVLGLGDDEIVEIRQGVTPGERIVVRGLETLTDGARVRVNAG
jgi:membrane fusion protein (multidrug efflux system)